MQVTDEIIDTVFNTNVKSVAFAFKHQLPAIEKSGGKGSVVVNTSVMGITATTQDSFHGAGIYSASKSAANMLTQYAVSTCLSYNCTSLRHSVCLMRATSYSGACIQ
jgi:NAD(P)-dependent dehydrogenase (short-subunit alcohol dehydrogenase family)